MILGLGRRLVGHHVGKGGHRRAGNGRALASGLGFGRLGARVEMRETSLFAGKPESESTRSESRTLFCEQTPKVRQTHSPPPT